MGSHQVLLFLQILSGLSAVRGIPRFTRKPPDTLYVPSGSTARFVWDYHVDNKTTEFDPYSPEWVFYNGTDGQPVTIGIEDGYNGSRFTLHKDCPPRLRGRVSKESKATLVILNVTISDNGIYGCHLVLTMSVPIQSKVQLIVTVAPTFLPSHPNKIYQIIEGKDLLISCTAVGPPTPNITWVNIKDGRVPIETHGTGSAVLIIYRINRSHAGEYECRAKNNPNKDSSTTRTSVIVYYNAVVNTSLSTKIVFSWYGKKVTLKCIADGLPKPNITWYNPSGQQIPTAITTITNGSHLTIRTEERADYGSYKCQSENVAGRVEHFINVTQLFPPGPLNVTIFQEEIQVSSVTVRWIKPNYDGGSPVIDYKVQINTNPPQEKRTSYTYSSFCGLTKDTHYKIKVYARNDVGYGKCSQVIFITKKHGVASKAHTGNSKDDKLKLIIGVIAFLLVLSLVFNLLLVALLRRTRQSEINDPKKKGRKTGQDESYENDIEMGDKTLVSQPIPEYETIQQLTENTNVQVTSSDDPSKYERLHQQAYSSTQEDKTPVYEPLRGHAKESAPYHRDNEQHPYESLNLANKNSYYQSLQSANSSCVI